MCIRDSVKVIQDTLGHKDISTTLNIYTDVTKELRPVSYTHLPDSISVYGERTARSLEYGAQYLLRPETGSDFASRCIPVGICDSELQRNL